MKAAAAEWPAYIEVTGHAVDRASLRALRIWQENARRGEGLYAWLQRQAKLAFAETPDAQGYRYHLGLRWAFEDGGNWPVLKTLVRDD